MEKITRESMLLLRKDMKPKKIIKMFGKPEEISYPGKMLKQMHDVTADKDSEKKLLSMERFIYYVPDGKIALVFMLGKLNEWAFFPKKEG